MKLLTLSLFLLISQETSAQNCLAEADAMSTCVVNNFAQCGLQCGSNAPTTTGTTAAAIFCEGFSVSWCCCEECREEATAQAICSNANTGVDLNECEVTCADGTPVVFDIEGSVETPVDEPVEAPVEEPVEAPLEEPVEAPVEETPEVPVDAPVEAPDDDFTDCDEATTAYAICATTGCGVGCATAFGSVGGDLECASYQSLACCCPQCQQEARAAVNCVLDTPLADDCTADNCDEDATPGIPGIPGVPGVPTDDFDDDACKAEEDALDACAGRNPECRARCETTLDNSPFTPANLGNLQQAACDYFDDLACCCPACVDEFRASILCDAGDDDFGFDVDKCDVKCNGGGGSSSNGGGGGDESSGSLPFSGLPLAASVVAGFI